METAQREEHLNDVANAESGIAAVSGQGEPAFTFTITHYNIGGGAGTSGDGALEVTGTIGQPDVGTVFRGSYLLSGGFWPDPSALFLDGFESGDTSAWSLAVP